MGSTDIIPKKGSGASSRVSIKSRWLGSSRLGLRKNLGCCGLRLRWAEVKQRGSLAKAGWSQAQGGNSQVSLYHINAHLQLGTV